jgi:hypothetical protein
MIYKQTSFNANWKRQADRTKTETESSTAKELQINLHPGLSQYERGWTQPWRQSHKLMSGLCPRGIECVDFPAKLAAVTSNIRQWKRVQQQRTLVSITWEVHCMFQVFLHFAAKTFRLNHYKLPSGRYENKTGSTKCKSVIWFAVTFILQ